MLSRLRQFLPLLKILFTLAILFFVGRQFYRDLNNPEFPRLLRRSLQPGWLALSGILYLAGLGFSALFWLRLLHHTRQPWPFWPMIRAYYLGHFGKYLPGKAWALFLRASLARSEQVNAGVAVMTGLYEVLTTMAAGALLGVVVFWTLGHDTPGGFTRATFRQLLRGERIEGAFVDRRLMAVIGLGLFALFIFVLAPAVFNRLAQRVAKPFQEPDAAPPPRLSWIALLEGLALTTCGWFLLGASLWVVIGVVSGQPAPLPFQAWAKYSGFLSLAYVLGFVVILVPSGVGVREYFLQVFLVPELMLGFGWAEEATVSVAVMTVVLLRIVWTAMELIFGAVLLRQRIFRLVSLAALRKNGE